jgi:pyruvate dehydrogenase E1 component alpha subunit
VSFFGDGASNEGAFHEALNMASVYEVPAIFVCENNQYGASTSIKRVLKIENIADRAAAYGMRGDIADGMDVFNVYSHTKRAVDMARSGKGPTLLELKTFRLCGHSRRDPNNYMTEEEKELWKKQDPIPRCEIVLRKAKMITDAKISALRKETEEKVTEAIEYGRQSPEPKPEDTLQDLYVTMEVPQ